MDPVVAHRTWPSAAASTASSRSRRSRPLGTAAATAHNPRDRDERHDATASSGLRPDDRLALQAPADIVPSRHRHDRSLDATRYRAQSVAYARFLCRSQPCSLSADVCEGTKEGRRRYCSRSREIDLDRSARFSSQRSTDRRIDISTSASSSLTHSLARSCTHVSGHSLSH